ncbi:aminopeptidase [Levilactobacillus bambusae]|uniref:Aminopeptidase n=1 Tax=Levilactobacillus bambusae TaxID=2024736 RepID=A0A2V1MXZ1_9LACO|nr:aminopeptidase [Levilactobacillus bambusae]PWF99910.1 aminopeptidase [Levilactobacillus bambusae]
MNDSNFERDLKKYAYLIVETGANVQPGQTVVVAIAVDQQPLAHLIMEAAYERGANEVIIDWKDDLTTKNYLLHTTEKSLATAPRYLEVQAKDRAADRVTRISVVSSAPDAYAEVAADRISAYQAARGRALAPVRKATQNNDLSWVVVAAAGRKWAQEVFSDLTDQAAVSALWQEIFKTTRIDQPDPEAAWDQHVKALGLKADWLNHQQFDALHYVAPHTDLTVGLPQHHLWEAAGSYDAAHHFFIPNMPTEEVFTAPDRLRVNGTVRSTRPLSYAGTLINQLQLTFKNGKIVEATAAEGEHVLQQLIETDAGSQYLGEAALVPDNSPISQSGIVFLNTLFDENAADHLAIGAAYPTNIRNGSTFTDSELLNAGLNISQVHVDFMIGSSKMAVDGLDKKGQVTPIMRNGNWV